ncbi:MAG: transposase [Microcoleus sp. PH2017_29_MFU_D_A]|uniref:RNA-guided endonuclease InsQ/TnpB family protein n=1 Tax=unclassified Microcoleus TaxID=2642155 RepID=UPI001DE67225|nr:MULTISPECIES: transposase [unclassified Microcoleus]MCC3417702.1 transposase [Microcoleus sp. PH2017_07_MST_O_A]MCC3468692.1 transposase [Microcoleus sp. PH2017_06_SFM_O_A]MCC3426133.1 transposase [Microcoleus sp. PH2017_01_SCD_O_A]MCC3446969.1 transposase [Microcoleus sp. PH2017_09_SFU_O_A]MCC3492721.1 transposase [Microcoleus sp. PH2017_16_JOR_D_A]
MLVLLSIKTKLKLTSAEKQLMSKHAGIARFTYNWGLATWQNLYQDGLKPNKYILKKFFNNYVKPELEWIKEKGICQKITQYAFDQLGNAFDRFFKGLGAYPHFKKKFQHDAFTLDAGGKPMRVGGVRIKLPTIGWIRTFEGLPNVTTSKITISRIADDWYLSFAYEQSQQVIAKQYEVVGVDLGVKTLATLSTGVVFENPKYYYQEAAKLKRLQKQLSRKKKGSNRRFKARMKVARQHSLIANLRNNTLHHVTTYLSKNHAKVVIEDLNIAGMMANHRLAKAIADCGFHEFRRQLKYKCRKFGSELMIISRWYPSSKTCSSCGNIQDMPLKKRTYDCCSCGISIDRDLNASLNISRLA